MKYAFPAGLAFSGGYDHPGIRDRDADARYDFSEGVVSDPVVKRVGVDVVGMADPWDADGMRSYAFCGFQVFGMHQHTDKIITVKLKAEEDSEADVVDPAVHGAVHGFRVPGIIMFGAGGVQLFIAFPVVGFLEEDVGPNPGVLQLAVILPQWSLQY